MRLLVVISALLLLGSCESEALVIDKTAADLELINGVLQYQDSPFEGLLVAKHTDASYKMKLQYVAGRKDGYEKQWYENGQLSQSRLYFQGIKTGKHEGWWQDGTPKFEYHFNTKGEYHGSRKEWYANGQLVRDFNYAKGKEIGSQRLWADNGKIRANYVVKNGERFGLIGLKKCYTVNTTTNALE